MELLVVDNETISMHSLTRALKGYPYDLVSYKQVRSKHLEGYDKIILSGGHAFGVLYPNSKYRAELELVRSAKNPILGICLGFQLICRAYGARLGDLRKYERRILKIRKIKADPVLRGLPKTFSVFENHRHVVLNVSSKLIPLAASKDGIEIVRHYSKPIWGTQFHPEKFVKRTMGRKILYNFLEAKPY